MIVAVINERNSKDCVTKVPKNSLDINVPTSRLFEKSGNGNNKKPINNPTTIAS